MPARRQIRAFDLKHLQGFEFLVGVDEAGRGALAGPVVAAAVVVDRPFLEGRWVQANQSRINDSKQLSGAERETLWHDFETLAAEGQIQAGVGRAEVAEIEQLNILGATKLAMRRAIEGLFPPSAFRQQEEPDLFSSAEEVAAYHPQVSARILVDGLPLKSFPYPHDGIVKGDARSLTVAMASVIAKVSRDRIMVQLDAVHPGYGLAHHKGYGTDEHRDAILRLGRCPEHREAFLRKLMAGRADPSQLEMLEDGGGWGA